jgi:hypothetical protein
MVSVRDRIPDARHLLDSLYASYRFLSEGNTPYLDTFFHKVQIIQISPTICIT